MPKPTKPFNSVESQKLWSIILIMTSVFIIFYTPPIILFTFGNFNFTHNLFGIGLFLISAFYLLKTV